MALDDEEEAPVPPAPDRQEFGQPESEASHPMTVPSTPIIPPSIGSTSLQRIAQWISWTDTDVLRSDLHQVYYSGKIKITSTLGHRHRRRQEQPSRPWPRSFKLPRKGYGWGDDRSHGRLRLGRTNGETVQKKRVRSRAKGKRSNTPDDMSAVRKLVAPLQYEDPKLRTHWLKTHLV